MLRSAFFLPLSLCPILQVLFNVMLLYRYEYYFIVLFYLMFGFAFQFVSFLFNNYYILYII